MRDLGEGTGFGTDGLDRAAARRAVNSECSTESMVLRDSSSVVSLFAHSIPNRTPIENLPCSAHILNRGVRRKCEQEKPASPAPSISRFTRPCFGRHQDCSPPRHWPVPRFLNYPGDSSRFARSLLGDGNRANRIKIARGTRFNPTAKLGSFGPRQRLTAALRPRKYEK